MNDNLSQSSCEIIADIKNLQVSSEAKDLIEESSVIIELKLKENESKPDELKSSSSSDTSKPSGESSSTSSESDEPKKKRARKRKRHRKKKITSAYAPPRPFMARYKKIKLMDPTVQPKVHIRFDDDTGEPDKVKSDYNVKPRVIRALERNLTILENLKNIFKVEDVSQLPPNLEIKSENVFISLKPRIIKAILVT